MIVPEGVLFGRNKASIQLKKTLVEEYNGKIGTTEYGQMLVAVATEWNNALLVIENANIGWAVIQIAIDKGYENLYYCLLYTSPSPRDS